MSSMKGFSSSQKNLKAPRNYPDTTFGQEYVTVSKSGFAKHSQDVALRVFVPSSLIPTVIDAVQPTEDQDKVIFITGHGAKEGDSLKFRNGTLNGIEAAIVAIPDANTLILGTKLPSNPIGGTTEVQILSAVGLTGGEDGSLNISSGPVQYVLDGAAEQVTEDTVTPANNSFLPVGMTIVKDGIQTRVEKDTAVPANTVPVPIEIVSTSGTPATFNITTGEIAIHTTHNGDNTTAFDSTRIGDGSNLAAVNASNELLVKDTDVETVLTSIDGKDFATQTTLNALLTAFNAEDFATQTTLNALLTAFNAEDFATQTTLNALLTAFNAEDFASETTLAALAAEDFATQTTLDALLTAFNAEDFASQTTLAALLTAFNAEDFATQTTLAALLTAFNAEDFATETTLADISSRLPSAIGERTKADSLSVTFASDLSNVPVQPAPKGIASRGRLDYTVTPVTTGAYSQIVAATSEQISRLDIFDSSGQTLELAVGPAAGEVPFMYIFPGGNGNIPVDIGLGARVSVRAVSGTANVGEIAINFYGSD